MKFRRPSVFMKIVILTLLLYAGISLAGVRARVASAEAHRAALQAQVDAAARKNAELEYEIARADDPDVIASAARSKLGLVMPGEIIFYDIGSGR